MQPYISSQYQSQKSKIVLTQAAYKHLKELSYKQSKETYFRVRICRDNYPKLTHVIAFDDPLHAIPGDQIYNFNGLKLIFDPQSLSSIDNLLIDYQVSSISQDGKFELIHVSTKNSSLIKKNLN